MLQYPFLILHWHRIMGKNFDLKSSLFITCSLLSVQFSSVAPSCPTLCDTMDRCIPGFLSITNCRSLPKLMSIELVMPSNHLILSHPLLLLLSIFPSIRVFPMSQLFVSDGQSIGSFSFSNSPSNEYSGLISFKMD